MRFATYFCDGSIKPRFGFKKDSYVVDIINCTKWFNEHNKSKLFLKTPSSLKEALGNWKVNFEKLKELDSAISQTNLIEMTQGENLIALHESEITLLAPVPNPQTFRDFYAFEQHVRSARKLRGLEMHPDWFKIPIFYFSNPVAIFGHSEAIPYPLGTKELDFELEFAVIIANGGSNITSKNAGDYIAGYTVCNDWSARDLQRQEMAMNLGPAKGKDFATSFGPYMVTPDEVENNRSSDGKLHLRMTCHINGQLISDGNTNDLYHSFEAMIERASMNTDRMPGDYIGSGTVGTGCILELRPENTNGWIKRGDNIKLEVEQLGILENKIV